MTSGLLRKTTQDNQEEEATTSYKQWLLLEISLDAAIRVYLSVFSVDVFSLYSQTAEARVL